MTLFNATLDQISNITAIENSDIEFIFDGRLYQLEIDEERWEDLSYELRNLYGNDFNAFKTCKNVDFSEIVYDLRLYAEDVTESTEKGQAMLRKQARRSLLSYIVSSANKLRSSLKSLSLAMHTAWTQARILITGMVQFVKVGDVDTEGEIKVQSRRVASLSSHGIKYESITNTVLRFIDLEKIESGLAPIQSIISCHVWQVVSWNK